MNQFYYCIYGMKSSDFALVLQQQLDVCRQRDQPGLVGMY